MAPLPAAHLHWLHVLWLSGSAQAVHIPFLAKLFLLDFDFVKWLLSVQSVNATIFGHGHPDLAPAQCQ